MINLVLVNSNILDLFLTWQMIKYVHMYFTDKLNIILNTHYTF